MNTAERRGEILKILHNADAPVAARELAGKFGVSRQVIVQDIALLRASNRNILSTNKGFYAGNIVNNKGVCDSAGQQLQSRI